MSITLLAALILALTAAVVVAIVLVMWNERTSTRQSRIAVVSGVVLAAWAIVTAMLARRGFLEPSNSDKLPCWNRARSRTARVGCVPPHLSIVALPSHQSEAPHPSQPLATGRRGLPSPHGHWADAGALGIASRNWRRDRWCNGALDRRPCRHAPRETRRNHLQSIRNGRFGCGRGLGHHDQPGPHSGLSYHADVGAGDELSACVGADFSGTARLRASRHFVVAAGRWDLGGQSRRLTWFGGGRMKPQVVFAINVLISDKAHCWFFSTISD
jgi:hypothetical protein